MRIKAIQTRPLLILTLLACAPEAIGQPHRAAESAPAAYFRLLEAGTAKVQQRMNEAPDANLKTLEAQPEWRHFPYAILAPAVLYAKRHPHNMRFGDPDMLALAIRIGDLLASENEKEFTSRASTAIGTRICGWKPIACSNARWAKSDARDRLSLAYNTFFSDLYIPASAENELCLSLRSTKQ